MIRPCFLVVDQEHSGSISTRKLVIETAKLNVITAYSGKEAIETAKKFPGVDGLVLDADVVDIPLQDLVAELKQLLPSTPVIVIKTPHGESAPLADHEMEWFDPARLLDLLKTIRPVEVRAIAKNEDELRLKGQ